MLCTASTFSASFQKSTLSSKNTVLAEFGTSAKIQKHLIFIDIRNKILNEYYFIRHAGLPQKNFPCVKKSQNCVMKNT